MGCGLCDYKIDTLESSRILLPVLHHCTAINNYEAAVGNATIFELLSIYKPDNIVGYKKVQAIWLQFAMISDTGRVHEILVLC